MNKKTSLQKLSKSNLNPSNARLNADLGGNVRANFRQNLASKNIDFSGASNLGDLSKIASKPKILAFLFYALFAVFGVFAMCVIQASTNHTKPEPATFPQHECAEPKKFSKIQRDNIIYAYNFGAPHGMGYTLAAIAWQESCAGVYMMNFSDPSAGLYHAHIPVVLKYYSKYEDNAFTRNVMGQMLIDNRLFASQIALDTLLYWQKYHKGNHKNTIKSYNKGFKWQKDKDNNALAESYYNSVSKKMRALEGYIPRYSRVKNQSLFVELEDKNKQLEQTFKTLQNAKVIEKRTIEKKQVPSPQASQNPQSTKESSTPKQATQTTTQQTQTKKTTQATQSTQTPKIPSHTAPNTTSQDKNQKQEQKIVPPIKPFIKPQKDAPKPKFDNDDFIELPISPIKFEASLKPPKLANNQSQNLPIQNPPRNANAQHLQKLDEFFDDFNLVFEGK